MPIPGSSTRPPRQPSRSNACPDRPHDELRREMSVLRAARERGVVGITDRILQVGADRVPALRELGFARPAEDDIGKLRRAKPGKADQLPLLVNRRGPLLGLDL
ncbi:hypothetical protein ACVWW4_000584 [Bradyrhizobium sp. LB7.1]